MVQIRGGTRSESYGDAARAADMVFIKSEFIRREADQVGYRYVPNLKIRLEYKYMTNISI